MSRRWSTYLWRALAALGEAEFPYREPAARTPNFTVDLADDRSVRTAFRSIVEHEWGPDAFREPGPAG